MSQPITRSMRINLLILVGVMLLFTWLSSRAIHDEALWFDEVWSTRYAGGAQYGPISLPETVNRVIEQIEHERNPPGYYLLLNLWGRAAGWTEFAERMLSLFAGLLAIAWMYRFAYDVTVDLSHRERQRFALSAAAILGGSAFIVEYAREIRAYIFIVLLTTIVMTLYWRLANSRRLRKLLQAAYVLSVTAMLYVHYMTALVMIVLGLYHLMLMPKNRRWWRIGILTAISGILFLPWVRVSFAAAGSALDTFRLVDLSAAEIFRTIVYTFSNGSVALFAVLVAFALRATGRHARLIWFMAAGCLILALAFNTIYPVIINIRYVIFIWPFLALLAALGISYLGRRGINPAWILLIWVTAGALITFDFANSSIPNNVHMSWKPYVRQLQAHIQPGDVLAFHSPLTVWLQGPEFTHYTDQFPNHRTLLEDIPGGVEHDDYLTNARNFLHNAPRVWLAVDQSLTPNYRLAIFQKALSERYAFCYTAFNLPDMRLELYSRYLTDPAFRFGDSIGISLSEPLPASAADTLPVLLSMSTNATVPSDTYSVALHVRNAAGEFVAQQDFGLPNTPQSCTHVEIPVRTLPVGTYTLSVVVYNWHDGVRLIGTSPTGESNESQLIGTFERVN